MKVVLFCGGHGLRLRDYSQTMPKPLAHIDTRPIVWHLMNYYAHYGHHDYIMCLGYRGEAIKEYFLEYQETLSNDFVLSGGGRQIDLIKRDIEDWTIRFVDTGLNTNVGQRLRSVREHIGDDEVFLANYADGLSDLPLDAYIDEFMKTDHIAAFVSVCPNTTFHLVFADDDGIVSSIKPGTDCDLRINGGFFIFRREIFDYLDDTSDLMEAPFARLIEERRVLGYRHDGFWQCMDTFKDRQSLEEMAQRDDAPWQVWKHRPNVNHHA